MGINNRQRRAAKARQRAAHRRHSHSEPTDQFESRQHRIGVAGVALRQLIVRRTLGIPALTDDEFLRQAKEYQQLAIDDQLGFLIEVAGRLGWTVDDLYELARRRLPDRVVEHLPCAGAGRTEPSREWTRRCQLPWPVARDELIDLLVLLASLDTIAAVTPSADTQNADERVLRKVRALLAKAESTDSEDEADALTAKAQQLMTRYAISGSLAATGEPRRSRPALRRMWLDAPYVDAKSMLLTAVAASNHCRCVYSKEWGFVTLVGHDRDLDTVELLGTSLLVQATRAMTAAGSQIRYGVSRTRSYRQSFLLAYAARIRERLREAAAHTEADVDAERGGTLLPVLAARDDAVDAETGRLFPDLVSRNVTISDAAGWYAGRAAADLAQLDTRAALPAERGR